jgi:hypothetical protein
MKNYKHTHSLDNIKTYKTVEKYEKEDLKKEIEKLNKFYKNRTRETFLKLKEF